MDNFGIDLDLVDFDKVLDELEEQESRIELKNNSGVPVIIAENTNCLLDDKLEECSSAATAWTLTDAFSKHSSNYLINDETISKSTTKYLGSVDDQKNHITSNNILSSIKRNCKNFLCENVSNPVCCNESRVREGSGFSGMDVSSESEIQSESAWKSQNKLPSHSVHLATNEVNDTIGFREYAMNISEMASDVLKGNEVNEEDHDCLDNSCYDKSQDVFLDVSEDFMGTFASIENVVLKTSRSVPISLVVEADSYDEVLCRQADEGEEFCLDVKQMQNVLHRGKEIILLENLKEPDANIDLNLLLKEDLLLGKKSLEEEFEEHSEDVPLEEKFSAVLQETSVCGLRNESLDEEDDEKNKKEKFYDIDEKVEVFKKLEDDSITSEVSNSLTDKEPKDLQSRLGLSESVEFELTEKRTELTGNVDTGSLISDEQKALHSPSDCSPDADVTVSEESTTLESSVSVDVLTEIGNVNLSDLMPVKEEIDVVEKEINFVDLNKKELSKESNKMEIEKISEEDEERALKVLQEEAAMFIDKMGGNFMLPDCAECEIPSSPASNDDDDFDAGIVADVCIEQMNTMEASNENTLQKKPEQTEEDQQLSFSQINYLPLTNCNEDLSHEIFKKQALRLHSVDSDRNTEEALTSGHLTDLNQFEDFGSNEIVEDHYGKLNGFQKDVAFNDDPMTYEYVVARQFDREDVPEIRPNTLDCYRQEEAHLSRDQSTTSHSRDSPPSERTKTEDEDDASHPHAGDEQLNENTETTHLSEIEPMQQPRSLQMTQPQFFHAPSRCSNIDLPITELGKVPPAWLPDSSTNKCLQCETPFSFLRRRHHCRACGLIFCNVCCNVRYPLEYLSNKEERVCCKCFVDFNRASSYQNMLSSVSASSAANTRPNPSNPNEYCSTVPPALQATSNDPLPPVMVPSGVLRKQGKTKPPSETKQVMFSDGIRPGGDLTHLDGRQEGAASNVGRKKKPKSSPGSSSKKSLTSSTSSPLSASKQQSKYSSSAKQASKQLWSPESGKLPPLVNYSSNGSDYILDYKKSPDAIFKQATDFGNPSPLTFGLNAQLTVLVKIIKKDCCVKRECWCFTTRGLCTVSQDEVVFLLERRTNETAIPVEIFSTISSIYDSAHNGFPIKNMTSTVLPHSDAHPELCGFLYVYHSIQCLQNILLPRPPYLFAIFIKQSELTWARAFPMRLFLRLGAEFRYYPCPLFGVRDRPAVYGDIGHTIMNLLVDFRNFQYTLSAVDDMAIHVEEKNTTILIPRHKHHQVLKVLSNSDDHVLAMAGNFSYTADSHLICLQNTEGSYQTQAMNIQGRLRSVTGASFMVFNGALKGASGYTAKMSIIEDGLMVQITPDDMTALKQALTIGEDFTITCGLSSPPASSSSSSSSSSSTEGVFDGTVSVRWFSEKISKGSDQLSPIDKLNLSQVEQKKIHASNVDDISPDGFTLIWTGLFFLEPSCASQPIRSEVEKFAESLAASCCRCLTPHLSSLFAPVPSMLSVRVNVGSDQIGYETGVNFSELSESCLAALDGTIIPILHGSQFASRSPDTSIELLFVITRPINA